MPRPKTSSDLELLVELDRDGADPLHRQVERALRSAIRDGRLQAGTVLPSSRALASQLGTSRGIVVEAYEQLVAEGYVVSRPGGSTQVARSAQARRPARVEAPSTGSRWDFRPGRPEVREFPRAVWLRALRRVLAGAPAERLTYQGGHGLPELRGALAAYLNRVRGTAADPGNIVICSGFAQGLALTLRGLREAGARRVAVEDPSDPEYRATIEAAGLDWVAIPVDDDGLRVDELASARADAVVVTAAHQYPTGAVLTPERRAALVAWAVRRGATIVEDDYDAEFRYDRAPIGAIQGLAPDRVVYAGSASKILAPGLRLGWLVVPERLVDPIEAAKQAADMGSAALDQLAFADVLSRGDLDHHLRRMRPIYRRRRDVLLAALERHLSDVRPIGASAGLHVLAWLPPGSPVDETAIVAGAQAEGIALAGLATRRVEPGPPGLIFGYGAIDAEAIDEGIERLAAVVARLRGEVAAEAGTPVVAVYGTLRRGERNHALMADAELLGSGWIPGRIHRMRRNADRAYGFPALVDDPAGRVAVEVYRLPDSAHLARLDDLESYDPAAEAGSEYLRRRTVVLEGPVGSAWIYRFAGRLPNDAERIAGGDWPSSSQSMRRRSMRER
jgi:GntR family transcriptional regulator / MocR family aminotransferase